MLIKITTKHFKQATSFLSNYNCPLAMALKDKFKTTSVNVGGRDADVNDKRYLITSRWPEIASTDDTPNGGADAVNDMIKKAKSGERVKTFILELTEK